ncbi:hypothetical protein N7519_011146 [Penicillium mononematosum]|uniref:uncharacterized protein n=1 Tax=Penicillium mononematosum TaxID=268346 RepID=UPI002547C2F1|nr:uncharacterized protein N7519_011146 [Penicillium mononematosum]KAJ6180685.1 hypothetical protein N7519_011146 [Penicillium mononematosum]
MGKRAMPDRSNPSSKKRKGGAKYGKQASRVAIESGDVGVFLTCDMGREGKCLSEAVDIFSQVIEGTENKEEEDEDTDDEDIEAQIRRELEGLQPSKDKTRQFQPVQMDMPCVTFMRLDPSIDPVQLVHRLCSEAHAHPETKKSRWIKRMHPVTSIRKTLSVDLTAFAKEILKPHFHSGGPPKTYAIRPTVRGNSKLNRDIIIKTVADAVGPEHPVNLKNYDLMILVDVAQNVIGMSVVQGDYDKLKRFNLAEIYDPSPKAEPAGTATESKA